MKKVKTVKKVKKVSEKAAREQEQWTGRREPHRDSPCGGKGFTDFSMCLERTWSATLWWRPTVLP